MLGAGLLLAATSASAQVVEVQGYGLATSPRSDTSPASENIIITKKGKSREKMTIVVDGDLVTVNGKPVDDFKGDQIEVRKTNGDVRVFTMPPRPPKMRFQRPTVPRPPAMGFNGSWSVDKGMLGVMTMDSNGVVIRSVVPKSAADSAGLQKGDRIVSVNGTQVYNASNFTKLMSGLKPNSVAAIEYERNGRKNTVRPTLKSGRNAFRISGTYQGNMDEWETFGRDLDGQLAELQAFDPADIASIDVMGDAISIGLKRPKLGLNVEDLPSGDGVKLYEAPEAETVAAKAGLLQNDILTKVDGTPIKDVDMLKMQLRNLQPGDSLTLEYTRNGQAKTTTLLVPKRIKKAGL